MDRLRHVSLARLAGAQVVFLEGHHRVERKQESVEEHAKDIVNALVENDSLEERISVFLLLRFDVFLDSTLLVFQVVRAMQHGV